MRVEIPLETRICIRFLCSQRQGEHEEDMLRVLGLLQPSTPVWETGPGARGQEPGARNQGPGARSQGPIQGGGPGYCPHRIWGFISRAQSFSLPACSREYKDHKSCSCPELGTINLTGVICIIWLCLNLPLFAGSDSRWRGRARNYPQSLPRPR